MKRRIPPPLPPEKCEDTEQERFRDIGVRLTRVLRYELYATTGTCYRTRDTEKRVLCLDACARLYIAKANSRDASRAFSLLHAYRYTLPPPPLPLLNRRSRIKYHFARTKRVEGQDEALGTKIENYLIRSFFDSKSKGIVESFFLIIMINFVRIIPAYEKRKTMYRRFSFYAISRFDRSGDSILTIFGGGIKYFSLIRM